MMKNLQLEGLRGFSSLLVFFGHVFIWEPFLPTDKFVNSQVSQILIAIFAGRIGVLLFFVLSGYVMGKAYHYNKIFPLRKYLLKRWVRIYPMYAIAVCFSAVLLPTSIWQVFGHLLFLNPNFTSAIPANSVLWSVSYEFGYYLIFPLIFSIPFFRKNKAVPVLVIAIVGSVVVLALNIKSYNISSWIVGFAIWSIGLVIAWNTEIKNDNLSQQNHEYISSPQNIWSGITAAIAIDCFSSGGITTFVAIPSILLVFSGLINYKISRKLSWILLLTSFALTVVLFLAKGGLSVNKSTYVFGLILALLSLLLMQLSSLPKQLDLTYFAPIGTISYGIYIFHMPIMYSIAKIPYLGGGWLEWSGRLLMACALVLFISYLVEIKVQPRIRTVFLDRPV
jgi:peptidoglycan/LPS O-acetylase OafA/YrhL